MSTPPRHLLLNRSRPDERAALEDWCSENGRKLLVFRPKSVNALADGDGYGNGDGSCNGHGGGSWGSSNGIDGGGGDGDGGGGGWGDGDSDDGGDGVGSWDGGNRVYRDAYPKDETTKMKNGLKIISTPSGAYCYVRVGWLRRVDGDEFEIVGARVIRRFGTNAALSDIAETGPIKTTELLVASKYPEEVHRLQIERSITCNEQAWASECPKPEGWKDT